MSYLEPHGGHTPSGGRASGQPDARDPYGRTRRGSFGGPGCAQLLACNCCANLACNGCCGSDCTDA